MKFTIWEKNNISALLDSIEKAPENELELLKRLREKFQIAKKEMSDWAFYDQLCNKKNRSDEQEKELLQAAKKMHQCDVEITLAAEEFEFLHKKIMGGSVHLPSSKELIDHSIRFRQKIKNAKAKLEEI